LGGQGSHRFFGKHCLYTNNYMPSDRVRLQRARRRLAIGQHPATISAFIRPPSQCGHRWSDASTQCDASFERVAMIADSSSLFVTRIIFHPGDVSPCT
jgi:hypothetical protein